MKLGIDFDSVLSDLPTLQTVSYNIKHGTSFKPEDITDWWWWKEQDHPEFVWGLDCFLNRRWMLATPPVAGAIRGMQKLHDYGHDLFVISDREPHMGDWIWEWLDRHRIPVNDVVVTSWHGYSKADAYTDLGIKVGLDDNPHNVERLLPHVKNMWIYTQPWNRQMPLIKSMRRADTWEDFTGEYA